MPIFELSKDDISKLTDTQLRELVARLCEAECTSLGLCSSGVRWSGSQTAADGGLDVEVQTPSPGAAGFLGRTPCGIQVKRPKMAETAIIAEMRPAGELRPVIKELGAVHGSYVIVSLGDDCSSKVLTKRRKAMRDALFDFPEAEQLHTDFIDRGHLVNWLRKHPSAQLWARETLGRPMTGWRPFGRWSSTPKGADDTLIIENGIRVRLPGKNTEPIALVEGINKVRQLISGSQKAIRFVGLSGVGKSRFVQALFEHDTGEAALTPAAAIYADLGDTLAPTVGELVSQLITLQQLAYLVLDNCPPEVHSRIATQIRQSDAKIRLLTIEYDVADDQPELTDVVHLDVVDGAIAEKLVERRYPELGQVNARKIAEFSGGNARLALALANQVEAHEDLSAFSDRELFERLFRQRQGESEDLLGAAEVLSLVYSFDIEETDAPNDELTVLSSLAEQTRLQLFQAADTLLRRQVAQRRGRWRAVLPHAVANRLARSALRKFPDTLLRKTFEAAGRERLLISFGRRLGFLHDTDEAEKIVRAWLAQDGILANLSELSEEHARLLKNVAPVAPELTLCAIECAAADPSKKLFASRDNPRFSTLVDLLLSLAYDDALFDRCLAILLQFVKNERPEERYHSIRDGICSLFGLYLSGTHAVPERRERTIRALLQSDDADKREIGLNALSKALQSHHFSSGRSFEFGARPRDYGYWPRTGLDETNWYRRFLRLALEGAQSKHGDVKTKCRELIANELSGLWRYVVIRPELLDAARLLNADHPWTEGWRATRRMMKFRISKADQKEVAAVRELASILEPKGLLAEISALVVGSGAFEDIDEDDPDKYRKAAERAAERAQELGQKAGHEPDVLSELGSALFTGFGGHADAFGRGLAQVTNDKTALWHRLSETFLATSGSRNFSALVGVLQELEKEDPGRAAALLETVLTHPELKKILVRLQSAVGIDKLGLDRLHRLLDQDDPHLWQFDAVGWGSEWEPVAEKDVAELLQHLASHKGGAQIAISALGMRIHGAKKQGPKLSAPLRQTSLEIVRKALSEIETINGNMFAYHLAELLSVVFLPEEEPEGCKKVVSALVDSLVRGESRPSELDDSAIIIAKRMPNTFLSELMYSDALPAYRVNRYFRSKYEKPPLRDIAAPDLVEWCRQEDVEARFLFVANEIFPFSSFGEESDDPRLTDQAVALLDSAPSREAVLSIFAKACKPNSWSGRRSDIIHKRRNALATALSERSDLVSPDLVNQVLAHLDKVIAADRASERRDDEAGEQTFE